MSRRPKSNIPALVGAIGAAMTTGGPTYAFGLYGNALKQNLGLSQGDLETISTAFFVAGLMSWAPGLFADRFGARLAIIIGGLSGCFSLISYWCIAKKYLVIESHFLLVSLLSLLGVFTFASSAMVTGSVFKVLTVTSGPSKGSAVGVAKGLVGLGSGVYTVMFESMKGDTESELDFLPMAGLLFVCFATIPAFCLIPSHKDLQSSKNFSFHAEPWHFHLIYCGLGGMALLIVDNSLENLLTGNEDRLRENKRSSWTAALLLALWWGPLLWIYFNSRHGSVELPNSEDEHSTAEYQLAHSTDEDDNNDNEACSNTPLEQNASSHQDAATTPVSDDISSDRNLVQLLQTPESYLLLWTAIIMVGSGTVETNNMGQMVEALGLSPAVTPASMALFSVAQASARVFTGAASESTLRSRGWPRPIYLIFASCIGICSHLLLSAAETEWVFIFGAILSGVNFGMVWPLLVLCVGEIFGPSHVGANYMFYDGVASAGGTLLLSKFIAQRVYDSHIDPATSPDAYTCIGADCFRLTHYLIAAFCLTAIGTSYGFVNLTKDHYQHPDSHFEASSEERNNLVALVAPGSDDSEDELEDDTTDNIELEGDRAL